MGRRLLERTALAGTTDPVPKSVSSQLARTVATRLWQRPHPNAGFLDDFEVSRMNELLSDRLEDSPFHLIGRLHLQSKEQYPTGGGQSKSKSQFAKILVKSRDDSLFPLRSLSNSLIGCSGHFRSDRQDIDSGFTKCGDDWCGKVFVGQQLHAMCFLSAVWSIPAVISTRSDLSVSAA